MIVGNLYTLIEGGPEHKCIAVTQNSDAVVAVLEAVVPISRRAQSNISIVSKDEVGRWKPASCPRSITTYTLVYEIEKTLHMRSGYFSEEDARKGYADTILFEKNPIFLKIIPVSYSQV